MEISSILTRLLIMIIPLRFLYKLKFKSEENSLVRPLFLSSPQSKEKHNSVCDYRSFEEISRLGMLPPMEWVRGEELGHGSFATIHLAIPSRTCDRIPSFMAVKSSDSIGNAGFESLRNEKVTLDCLSDCSQIIDCYGDCYSVENGGRFYNLLLEFASGGSLVDKLKKSGGRIVESEIRRYTRTILEGLSYIHSKGFVHCDLKLGNILLFDNGDAKIADFGLAKRAGESLAKTEHQFEWRGTPIYMAPESVNQNEYEPPCDIWALGCAVAEMATGKPGWNFPPDINICALFLHIGLSEELPVLPENFSPEGHDFLKKCFVKDPRKRWTAEMLLHHPFVATAGNNSPDEKSLSPRCPLEYGEWSSLESSVSTSSLYNSSPESSPEYGEPLKGELVSCFSSSTLSSLSQPADRFRHLVTISPPNWAVSDSWMTVR